MAYETDSPSAFAGIDLKALSRNLDAVRKKTKNKSAILAVVKAGAYGHGAVQVSRQLLDKGASMLGVAFADEAIELRDAGIKAPVLVFFDRDNTEAYFEYKLTPVVFDLETARRIADEAHRRRCRLPVHIKVDTGMGRIGFTPQNAFQSIIKISRMKNIELEGIMSHFSEADLADKEFALRQIENFIYLVKSLKKRNVSFKFRHMSNSAAVMSLPEAHFNMVRPGIMLYGCGIGENRLSPVLSLKSRIIQIKKVPANTPVSYGRTFITRRKSVIATVPLGYADGYNRKLSNCGEALVNGRRAPVAGRVCMDTVMLDVTEIPGVKENTEVVLIGRQGKEKITARDIADKIGTIPYEVLTSIGSRVKRVYKF
ncbi:MAG: alanine racemase [Nitrospirae bacterium]|nr:alanine racemase [Nitrospirota bacterium]MBI4838510.1 alanine racemase [Nitrospirota bacterium]